MTGYFNVAPPVREILSTLGEPLGALWDAAGALRHGAPDPVFMRAAAGLHHVAEHSPGTQRTARAYVALKWVLRRQALAVSQHIRVAPWTGPGEPYAGSEGMHSALRRGELFYLPTRRGTVLPEDHPMGRTMVVPHWGTLQLNDVFRIVHDVIGHGASLTGFGPRGEYWAYRCHAFTMPAEALPALAAETLCQNAWVNFGPHLGPIPPPLRARPFAAQKAYAVPLDFLRLDPLAPR